MNLTKTLGLVLGVAALAGAARADASTTFISLPNGAPADPNGVLTFSVIADPGTAVCGVPLPCDAPAAAPIVSVSVVCGNSTTDLARRLAAAITNAGGPCKASFNASAQGNILTVTTPPDSLCCLSGAEFGLLPGFGLPLNDSTGAICVVQNVCNGVVGDEALPRNPIAAGFRFAKFLGNPVPTVGEWGLIALGLLMLAGGGLVLRRRQAAAA